MSGPIGVLKVVVLGDELVGKSTLLDSWTEEKVVIDPVGQSRGEAGIVFLELLVDEGGQRRRSG